MSCSSRCGKLDCDANSALQCDLSVTAISLEIRVKIHHLNQLCFRWLESKIPSPFRMIESTRKWRKNQPRLKIEVSVSNLSCLLTPQGGAEEHFPSLNQREKHIPHKGTPTDIYNQPDLR